MVKLEKMGFSAKVEFSIIKLPGKININLRR